MKICTSCRTSKPDTEFHLKRAGGTRRRAECKTCSSQRSAEHRGARRATGGLSVAIATATRTHANQPTGKEKKCAKCGETKDTSRFNRDARRSDGLHPYCKDCRSVDGRRYLLEEEPCRTPAPTAP